jgi:MFS family permease
MKPEAKARIAGSLFFMLCGSAMAIFAVHIPAIETKLHLSHALLGSLLLLVGGGAFAAMELTGRFVDRTNSKLASLIGATIAGLALFGPGFATSELELGLATFALGFGIGALDVAMNAHALSVERSYSRPIFSSFHAYFSVGGLAGASLGALTLSLGMAVEITLPIFGVALIALAYCFGPWLLKDESHKKVEPSAGSQRAGAKLGYVIFIGVISGFAALSEGSAGDWSALELTSVLGTSESIAAFGLVSFSVAMFITRLAGDRLVAKYGRVFVVRWGSLVAALGIAMVSSAASIGLTLAGWAVLGLGAGCIVPQMFAMVEDVSEPAERGKNLSRVLALTYLGILAGPAAVGWLTIWLPLNLAIGLCGLLMLLNFLFTYRLRVTK